MQLLARPQRPAQLSTARIRRGVHPHPHVLPRIPTQPRGSQRRRLSHNTLGRTRFPRQAPVCVKSTADLFHRLPRRGILPPVRLLCRLLPLAPCIVMIRIRALIILLILLLFFLTIVVAVLVHKRRPTQTHVRRHAECHVSL